MKKQFKITGMSFSEIYECESMLAAIHQFLLDHPTDIIVGGRFLRIVGE